MADQEAAGDRHIEEAGKRLKAGKGGFLAKLMGSGSDAQEAAADLYVKGANCYKVAQKWEKAGDAFCSSGNLKANTDSKHEAATNYVDAALCYLKVDAEKSVDCYMRSVEVYTDMGRFSIAAKHLMTVAETYETKIVDMEKALQMYHRAGDFYKGEESTSSANKCYGKVAHIAAELEQYDKAIELFSEIGAKSAENNLLKYGAKEHFFKAVLCALALDHVRAKQCVDKYADIHPAFQDSREYKLCVSLISDVQNENVEEFQAHVADFDKVSRMDKWLTSLLLKIKRTLPASATSPNNSAAPTSGPENAPEGSQNQDFDEDDLS